MNVTFAFCAIVIAGAVPDFMEPIAPSQTASAIRRSPAWRSTEFHGTDRAARGEVAFAAHPCEVAGSSVPRHTSGTAHERRRHAQAEHARAAHRSPRFLPRGPSPAADDELCQHIAQRPEGWNRAAPRSGGTGRKQRSPFNRPEGLRQLQARAGHESLPLAGRSQQQRHRECLRGLCPAGTAATAGQPGIRPGERQLGQRARAACPQLPARLPELRFVLSRRAVGFSGLHGLDRNLANCQQR